MEKFNKNIFNDMNNTFCRRSNYYPTPEIDDSLNLKINRLKEVISNLENNFSDTEFNFTNKDYKIDYAKELNKKQLEAVATINGKTLVIAGAGSGKTRTLTYRTSFLLENSIDPNKILILTFTKKAAGEIKKRVNQLLSGEFATNITSGTFHSFCNMLLMRYHKIIGVNPKFTILDQRDSEDLIDLLKHRLDIKKNEKIPFPRKSTIYDIISSSRNLLIPIDEIIEKNYTNFDCYIHEIIELAKEYDISKQNSNLYDYDDLIDEVNHHLKENLLFRDYVQNKYQYIMVDEYQDTNIPQKQLIDLLSERSSCSLMVVGDDNQSIYSFRGANYENILTFGETYPNAKLIKLEQNYRSTSNILNFINSVSDNILLGYKKHLFSNDVMDGSKPEFIHFGSDEQEAEFIADNIIKIKDRVNYNEIAVLCRSSFHSNFVQAEFIKRQIPFIVVGGIKFIEKRHVKDILAYIKLLWNPLDAISWHRILTILDGIGSATANKIIQDIEDMNGSLLPLQNKIYIKKNPDIIFLYDTLTKAMRANSLIDKLSIIEEYYIPLLRKLEDDWKIRIEDFSVLKQLCIEYKTVEEFISNLTIDPPNDSNASFTYADSNEATVTISTIHSAKGLEWNTVFVISLIDGLVPHYKSFTNYEELEEERKLFYVACSRAKEKLYLTAPAFHKTYDSFFCYISRFVKEIEQDKYQYQQVNNYF